MTTFNKSSLQNLWINGFVPQGSDYTNLIQSQVNIAETALQAMAGPLSVTELDTPLVSAATGNITTINATTLNVTTISAGSYGTIAGTSLSVTGIISAATVNVGTVITGRVSATVSVVTSKVSALKVTNGVTIISAAGTTQATAGFISSNIGINRLQGTSDGQQTGYLLPTPSGNIGFIQTLVHEGTVSGNLWPSVGCHINALGANAAFALAANTPYIVSYTQASAYAVK